MNIVAYKALLVAGCLLALAGGLRFGHLLRRGGRWEIWGWWVAARLVPFVVLYLLAGFPPHSDLATCFWPQAHGIIAGQMPYRDFESFFSPLFPALLAPPVLVWNDPRGIVLWLSLLEALIIAATARAARSEVPDFDRTRFYAYAFLSPGTLILSVIGAQEEFLLWGFGLLAWFALRRSRAASTGAWVAGGLLCTKALFLLPAAGFLGWTSAKGRFLAVVGAVGAVTLALLVALTGTAFLQVLDPSHNISPPNLWIWLHWITDGLVPAGGRYISFSVILALLLGALAGGIWLDRHGRRQFGPFANAWVLLFAMLMLVSPKSMFAYLGNFTLPMLAVAGRDRLTLGVAVGLGALGGIESSLWYRIGAPLPIGLEGFASPALIVEMLLQTLMLAGLVFCVLRSWRQFASS